MTGDTGSLAVGVAREPLGRVQARGRAPNSPPRTLLIVLLVVLVLLVANIVALDRMLPWSEEEEEPPEDQPWNMTVAAEVIEGDETWEGRVGDLERPVRVAAGGSLRLVDCDIKLRLEDIIHFRCPFFQVDPGGSLELVRSTVELVEDPKLEGAMVGPVSIFRNVPYVSRVVNLDGTEDPRIEFDVMWLSGGTGLSIAAQATQSGPLEVLRTIRPRDPGPHEWTHYNVSLAEFIGYHPRLVLYFDEYPRDIVMVSGLRVLDGGHDLPHDVPFSGIAGTDRWDIVGFWNWMSVVTNFGYNSEIVLCDGTLVLADSVVRGPEGIPRRASSDYNPEDVLSDRRPTYNHTIWASYRDLHVAVAGGVLAMAGSTIENVPITVHGSIVDIGGCRLVGESDVLTIHSSEGFVSAAEFVFRGPSPDLRWYRDDSRPLWTISIENTTDLQPMRVWNCTFDGPMLGLNLVRAKVDVQGCTFQGATRLVVWDHESTGLGGWRGFLANNTVAGGEGALYLRTSYTDIEFSDGPRSGFNYYYTDAEGSYRSRLMGMQMVDLVSQTDAYDRVRLLRPEFNVSLEGWAQDFGALNLSYQQFLDEGKLTLAVPQAKGPVVVDVEEYLRSHEEPWAPPELPSRDISLDGMEVVSGEQAPNGTKEYTFPARIMEDALWGENLTITVSVDGEVVSVSDVYDVIWVVSRNSLVANLTIWLSEGVHNITVTTNGFALTDGWNLTEAPVEIGNRSFRVLRAGQGTSPEELGWTLGEDDAQVLMEPNVTLAARGVEVQVEWGETHRVYVRGAQGAAMDIVGLSWPSQTGLWLQVMGRLDLRMRGLDGDWLYLISEDYLDLSWLDANWSGPADTRLQLLDSAIEYVSVYTNVASFELDNVTVGYASLGVYGQCGVEIRGCSMGALEAQPYFNASYNITDSTFTWKGRRVEFPFDGWRSIDIRNCSFEGSQLFLPLASRDGSPSAFSVEGCRFVGDGAALVIDWDQWPPGSGPDDGARLPPTGTVRGNVFSGQGSGLVLRSRTPEGVVGLNSLIDGARMYVWFRTTVTATASAGGCTRIEPTSQEGVIVGFPIYGRWDGVSTNEYDVITSDFFVDVTEDPTRPGLQHDVDVILSWGEREYSIGPIAEFASFDIREEGPVLLYDMWPDLDTMLRELIVDLPWRGP